MTALDNLFVQVRAENRAALIAYIPAGFPSQAGCAKVIQAFVDAGVDAIEIGFPYSDPVMDGPTIQAAAVTALENGTGSAEVMAALKVATGAGVAAVVMTYWNPIERFGVTEFAEAIAANGGSGVITPDLTIEESAAWLAATKSSSINPIYVVKCAISIVIEYLIGAYFWKKFSGLGFLDWVLNLFDRVRLKSRPTSASSRRVS